MTNRDDPVVPDDVARLSNAISRTLAQAGASHGDGLLALIHVLLTAVVCEAKNEAEAVEHVDRIVAELRARVRSYQRRYEDGTLITRLQ